LYDLKNITPSDRETISFFVINQIKNIFPSKDGVNFSIIGKNIGSALERTRVCINSVKIWKRNYFNIFHSSQYCIFLYYLSNTIWKVTGDDEVPTKIFLLNKALNSIDLFYEIEMPERFFIGHSVGIVFAKATYSDFLAVYQNSTVGKNHSVAPIFDGPALLYPNTAVIGGSRIAPWTVVSVGTKIVNSDTVEDAIVFPSSTSSLVMKKGARNIFNDIFYI